MAAAATQNAAVQLRGGATSRFGATKFSDLSVEEFGQFRKTRSSPVVRVNNKRRNIGDPVADCSGMPPVNCTLTNQLNAPASFDW